MATTLINQVAWDFSNIQYTIDVVAKVGNRITMLAGNIPIGAAVTEISYDGKIEQEDMPGASRQSQDETDGLGTYEASWTLEKYGSDYLFQVINGLSDYGIGTVRLNIGVTLYKPGIDPVTDTIRAARILNPSSAFKAGKDTNKVQMALKPHRVFWQGKDLFGEPIA